MPISAACGALSLPYACVSVVSMRNRRLLLEAGVCQSVFVLTVTCVQRQRAARIKLANERLPCYAVENLPCRSMGSCVTYRDASRVVALVVLPALLRYSSKTLLPLSGCHSNPRCRTRVKHPNLPIAFAMLKYLYAVS